MILPLAWPVAAVILGALAHHGFLTWLRSISIGAAVSRRLEAAVDDSNRQAEQLERRLGALEVKVEEG